MSMPPNLQLKYPLFICFLFLSACAFQYVDDDGARHIWGLTHTVVKEIRKERSEVVAQQVSAVGISVLRLPEHSGLSIGYTKNFSIQINSRVEGGVFSFSPGNPTDVQYEDLLAIIGRKTNVQTQMEVRP